jgi:hypothetical protein
LAQSTVCEMPENDTPTTTIAWQGRENGAPEWSRTTTPFGTRT